MISSTSTKPFKQIPLEELSFYETEIGIPCFYATVDDIVDQVISHGINFFYVIAYERYSYKDDKGITKWAKTAQVFKVTNTAAYRSVMPTEDFGLETVKRSHELKLPKIPWTQMCLMDQFFRAVYKKHGTEATVILTYDTAFLDSDDPSEGWGCLIPEQQNTSSHCDYSPISVADEIPNSTTLEVGTVHSHPLMSAFASHTDHGDQSEQDGLHITYGWSTSTNMATEYHCELQVDGYHRVLEPSEVFEQAPALEPDPIVDKWIEKVTKASTFTQSSAWSSGTSGTKTIVAGTSGSYSSVPSSVEVNYLPEDAPRDGIIIGLVESANTDQLETKSCPFCMELLSASEMFIHHLCFGCRNYVYLSFDNLSVDWILSSADEQSALGAALSDNINEQSPKEVYIWHGNREFTLLPLSSDHTEETDPKD